MPLDPDVARFLERLEMSSPRSARDLSVEQRREAFARLLSLWGEPDAVDNVTDRLAITSDRSIPLRLYTPLHTTSAVLPGLVYFHGGGLVAGSLDTHDGICRALANASGCKLISVGYRLAPEAKFPTALEDACAATRWVFAKAESLRIDPAKVGVGGDSAGGTLAAAVCQQLSGPGEQRLAFQLLICPILDWQARTESRRNFNTGYLLDETTIEHDLAFYLREADDPSDPRISPLRSEQVETLPPAVIQTAECDPVRDEGALFAVRLRSAGVPASYRCHSGMTHLFYGLKRAIPYATTAYLLLGVDLRTLLELRKCL